MNEVPGQTPGTDSLRLPAVVGTRHIFQELPPV
jgi:hypothetical protein